MDRLYTRTVAGLVLWLVVAGSATGLAQTPGASTQQRFLQEQLRPLIEPDLTTPSPDDRLLLDYGAIVRSTTAWYEDPGFNPIDPFRFQDSRALHIAEIRPWTRMAYGGVHRGYVRGQFSYLSYYKGDHFGRNHDWQGPYLDLGFYQFDVDESVRRTTNQTVETWSADVSVGRQFLFVGRGITFGLNSDAVSLDWAWRDWAGLVFGSQSVQRGNDLLNNQRGIYQRSDREFFGAQVEYQGWDRRDLYGYVVAQWDTSNSSSGVEEYDSEYWGVGSSGELLFGDPGDPWGIPNLRYFTEFIIQRGQSGTDINSREQIRSWAADAGINYYWDAPSRPRFTFEYARASGDDSRGTQPAQPQLVSGGNADGTSDTTFLGFGYLNTGASFAPLFSNLEFIRFGAAARPFDDSDSLAWQNFEVGASSFVYWRPESDASVSDLRANIPGERFLGHEWDLFVNWQMSSDLLLLINYGVFFPHDGSFSAGNDKSRQFFTVNLNWLL